MSVQTMTSFIKIAGVYELIKSKTQLRVIGVSLLVLFMTLGAYATIRLPFSPVPITFQTFFVLVGAVLLGKKLSSLSQVIYLSFGAIGIPVFSSFGAGLTCFAGPTGGYLIGFVLASFVMGSIQKIKVTNSNLSLIILLIIGDFVLFFCGIFHLIMFLHFSFINALLIGLIPFIPGEIVKIAPEFTVTLSVKVKSSLHVLFVVIVPYEGVVAVASFEFNPSPISLTPATAYIYSCPGTPLRS